jgi:hypothetical protein
MFELVGLYRGKSGWAGNAGYLFEGVIGPQTNDWDLARQAAQQIMRLPLDHASRPLRIRIRPAQPATT